MTRIVHLSDLHFGRDRPELLTPLIDAVNELAPKLVVISGDFTQRARASQFRAARAFLNRLRAPWLATPGNHDVPLDRPLTRLFRPWAAYRAHIANNLAPTTHIGDTAVIGVNTVNSFDWQRGRLGAYRIARLKAALKAVPSPQAIRIVVAHHPFVHAPHEKKALLRGAQRALQAMATHYVDVVLSGHLHSWRAEPVPVESRRVLMVQAGTGLSTRLRGEKNDFNLLEIAENRIVVERFVAGATDETFISVGRSIFLRCPDGWAADPQHHVLSKVSSHKPTAVGSP